MESHKEQSGNQIATLAIAFGGSITIVGGAACDRSVDSASRSAFFFSYTVTAVGVFSLASFTE